jgi:hypothetical protein
MCSWIIDLLLLLVLFAAMQALWSATTSLQATLAVQAATG